MSSLWTLDVATSEQLTANTGNSLPPAYEPASPALPEDIALAVTRLEQLLHTGEEQIARSFNRAMPLLAARAPGRLDVMGGIADYSGSTVLQMPLHESTVVLCQPISEPALRVFSLVEDSPGEMQIFSAPMADFQDQRTALPLSDAHMRDDFSQRQEDDQWAAYVAGVLSVLLQQDGAALESGVALLISSTVPMGKGVSSSAALEVASMRALSALLGLRITAHQQAILCQRVENHIVGAPCGLMDQMTSSCAQPGALLNMLCQPDVINEPVLLPNSLKVFGIDSGIRHAVSGADYSTVRNATFMGYRYLLEAADIAHADVPATEIHDMRWSGYLANVSVSELLQNFVTALPDEITGRAFLDRFDDTTDSVTHINPDTVYRVKSCTSHPIHEHFRAQLFAQLAHTGALVQQLQPIAILMGECMYQSHAGYTQCGLDSNGTSELVARLSAAGISKGIYGARITGGGSGGVVAVLADASAEHTIRTIAAEYACDSSVGGYVFSDTSPGASVYQLAAIATAQ